MPTAEPDPAEADQVSAEPKRRGRRAAGVPVDVPLLTRAEFSDALNDPASRESLGVNLSDTKAHLILKNSDAVDIEYFQYRVAEPSTTGRRKLATPKRSIRKRAFSATGLAAAMVLLVSGVAWAHDMSNRRLALTPANAEAWLAGTTEAPTDLDGDGVAGTPDDAALGSSEAPGGGAGSEGVKDPSDGATDADGGKSDTAPGASTKKPTSKGSSGKGTTDKSAGKEDSASEDGSKSGTGTKAGTGKPGSSSGNDDKAGSGSSGGSSSKPSSPAPTTNPAPAPAPAPAPPKVSATPPLNAPVPAPVVCPTGHLSGALRTARVTTGSMFAVTIRFDGTVKNDSTGNVMLNGGDTPDVRGVASNGSTKLNVTTGSWANGSGQFVLRPGESVGYSVEGKLNRWDAIQVRWLYSNPESGAMSAAWADADRSCGGTPLADVGSGARSPMWAAVTSS